MRTQSHRSRLHTCPCTGAARYAPGPVRRDSLLAVSCAVLRCVARAAIPSDFAAACEASASPLHRCVRGICVTVAPLRARHLHHYRTAPARRQRHGADPTQAQPPQERARTPRSAASGSSPLTSAASLLSASGLKASALRVGEEQVGGAPSTRMSAGTHGQRCERDSAARRRRHGASALASLSTLEVPLFSEHASSSTASTAWSSGASRDDDGNEATFSVAVTNGVCAKKPGTQSGRNCARETAAPQAQAAAGPRARPVCEPCAPPWRFSSAVGCAESSSGVQDTRHRPSCASDVRKVETRARDFSCTASRGASRGGAKQKLGFNEASGILY
jgi:hypothetical protein